MAIPTLILNGNDWTWMLNEKSIKWNRKDVDTDNTKRSPRTAKMYRKRLAVKRKISVSNLKRLTTAQIVALNAEMNRDSFTATILDAITGTAYNMTCYNSTVEAATQVYDALHNETYWADVSFNMTEM